MGRARAAELKRKWVDSIIVGVLFIFAVAILGETWKVSIVLIVFGISMRLLGYIEGREDQ